MIVEINDKKIKITQAVLNVIRVFTEEHPEGYVIGLETIVGYEHILTYYPLSRYELINVR